MLSIMVAVVCVIRQSVEWVGGVVIGQDLFGGLVILVGVMVGFFAVISIFIGVKRGGGQGIGRGVLLVGRWFFIKDVRWGVIFFVKVIVVGVMVGFGGVISIFFGVERGGGQGFGCGVLLVGRYIKDFGCGVIIFVKVIIVIVVQMVIEGCWLAVIRNSRVRVIGGEIVVVV